MNATDSAVRLDFTEAAPDAARGLQVAPLIDVVFLLICFFMLASQLIQYQKDPAVELPVMANAKGAGEQPTDAADAE